MRHALPLWHAFLPTRECGLCSLRLSLFLLPAVEEIWRRAASPLRLLPAVAPLCCSLPEICTPIWRAIRNLQSFLRESVLWLRRGECRCCCSLPAMPLWALSTILSLPPTQRTTGHSRCLAMTPLRLAITILILVRTPFSAPLQQQIRLQQQMRLLQQIPLQQIRLLCGSHLLCSL